MAQAAAARMASSGCALNRSLRRLSRCGGASIGFRLFLGFWEGQIQRIEQCFKMLDRQFGGHSHFGATVGAGHGAAANDDGWTVAGHFL